MLSESFEAEMGWTKPVVFGVPWAYPYREGAGAVVVWACVWAGLAVQGSEWAWNNFPDKGRLA